MNVLLQRHGIVIKTINVSGDRASIGSGETCDVMIDDPYLAAHVADLVKRPDGWHIVDTATSMDGVVRDGTRVDDELVMPNAVYSVGGFELVVQDGSAAPRTFGGAAAAAPGYLPTIVEDVAVPRTMMEVPPTMMELAPDSAREIPRTMYEAPIPPSAQRVPAAPVPQPIPYGAPPAGATPVAVPKKGTRMRLVLIVAAVLMLLLLLIVIVGRGGDTEKATVAAKPKPAPVATTAPAPVAPVATAPQLLAQLKYDDALALWQKQIDNGSDPSVRERYAALALEVARIHEANGSPAATSYYEKVAKYGVPGSAAVLEANRKLGR